LERPQAVERQVDLFVDLTAVPKVAQLLQERESGAVTASEQSGFWKMTVW
jgi:hypothetical protein